MSRIGVGACLVVCAACGGGATLITPPPPGSVEFTFTFRPDSEDLATAEALGWQSGIPAADVTVRPADSSAAPQTFRSSAQGTVVLPDLPFGDYVVEVQRWLSSSERAALPTGDDAVGFAAIHSVRLAASGGTAVVAVPASRRHSLVISEWAFNVGEQPGLGSYYFGGFAELYNNGDSTVYLDGMALGRGLSADYDYPTYPCALHLSFSDDPTGVWSLRFQVFPGSGRDYPVPPGGKVVVATDAIDHRRLYPDALDLRGADFEFVGTEDADNPAVPNMMNVGYDRDLRGHGVDSNSLGSVLFLAQSLDYSGLTMARYPGTVDVLEPRIPAGRLLDVLAVRTNWVGEYRECVRTVNARFDREGFRGRGPAGPVEFTHSVERRATPVLIGGRTILLHTRTGDADFFRGSRTPGEIPR